MSNELTRDQIETWRKDLLDGNEDLSDDYITEVHAICDLALRALEPSPEAASGMKMMMDRAPTREEAYKEMYRPIATVIDNNQAGWTNIIETAPGVTLLVGTKLYILPPAPSTSELKEK